MTKEENTVNTWAPGGQGTDTAFGTEKGSDYPNDTIGCLIAEVGRASGPVAMSSVQ